MATILWSLSSLLPCSQAINHSFKTCQVIIAEIWSLQHISAVKRHITVFWGVSNRALLLYVCMCERRCSCWQTSQGIAWKPTSSFTARSLAPVRKASFCSIELETQSMKGALMYTCFWQGMHGNMQSSCWRNWFSPCKWQLGRYIFRPCSFKHL